MLLLLTFFLLLLLLLSLFLTMETMIACYYLVEIHPVHVIYGLEIPLEISCSTTSKVY